MIKPFILLNSLIFIGFHCTNTKDKYTQRIRQKVQRGKSSTGIHPTTTTTILYLAFEQGRLPKAIKQSRVLVYACYVRYNIMQ